MPAARVFQAAFPVLMAAMALSGCMQTRPMVAVAPQPAQLMPGDLDAVAYGRAPVAAAPVVTGSVPVAAYAPASYDNGYRLDAGDKLRVVVYGQDGLTNSYSVDASGSITMPLIGRIPARGATPAELARAIAAKLRDGFIREPYVAAEVESYRPFFILGEVQAPGQYPYVPNMTVESAVAIAGGYTPRAFRNTMQLDRNDSAGTLRSTVSPLTPVRPGDTITIAERWF